MILSFLFSECTSPVALIANLPDSCLTADSFTHSDTNNYYSPIHSRLHNTDTGIGAWQSGNNAEPWIQADLLNVYYISAVATQGRGIGIHEQWVTEYTLSYGFSASGLQNVLDEAGNTNVFSGNSERFNVVMNSFFPVRAQIVRLTPTDFNSGAVLRWEVYGCITGR